MATKTIQTRIKNRFDTLANWQGAGVTLLPGEIALVSVTTQQIDKDTGDVVNVPAVLMKVGESDGNGGTKSFDSLPWISALAADVYDWAKGATSEDIPVTIKVGDNNTSDTLGGWLKSINDKVGTNATGVAANTAAINTLKGTTTGSVAKAIKDAIDAIDFTDTSATTGSAGTSAGKFVTVVTQTNGKIAVQKRSIAEIDLPDISASKIKVDASTTLTTKLSDMDALIAANTAKLTGHTDTAINTLIDNKLNNLDLTADPASGGEASATENFVTQVRQNNGQVSYSRKTLPVATSSKKGIVTLGANGGAATYASVFGTDGKGGINAQIETNKTDIASLKASVTGGVHFIGTVTAKPTTSSVSITKDGTTKTVTAAAGDIVVWATKSLEYIYTGSAWEELGDPSGLGAMIEALDYDPTTLPSGDPTDHKFVTKVTQENGLINVKYAQPTSADIKHSTNSTVNAKLGDIDTILADVYRKNDVFTKTETGTQITTAINALDFTAPTASGNTTSFIDSVSQTDGKITATKKTIPSASTSAAGIVKLGTGATDAAAGNHNHNSDYAPKTEFAAVSANYVKFVPDSSDNTKGKLYVGKDDTTNVIIFDCGGAADF